MLVSVLYVDCIKMSKYGDFDVYCFERVCWQFVSLVYYAAWLVHAQITCVLVLMTAALGVVEVVDCCRHNNLPPSLSKPVGRWSTDRSPTQPAWSVLQTGTGLRRACVAVANLMVSVFTIILWSVSHAPFALVLIPQLSQFLNNLRPVVFVHMQAIRLRTIAT